MGLGILLEVQRMGLSVADRLEGTGSGRLPFSQVCVPPLTTERPNARNIGLPIAGKLLKMAEAIREMH